MSPALAVFGRPSDMDNGMPVDLAPEQRRVIEQYLANADGAEAACLWRNIIGAHGAGVAWKEIGWLAEMFGVPEEIVEALLIGLDVIDWDGQHRDRLINEGDPWTAFSAIGINVPKPSPAPQAIASRDDLRAAYDEAIRDIEAVRGTQQFEDGFHGRVADAVFDACYGALEHYSAWLAQKGPADLASAAQLRATRDTQPSALQPRLHVVSAPMGTGKTTFAMCFMAAITQLAEDNPRMPFGCVLLVDQIVKADDRFRELSQLLPDKVAIWTGDHDPDCRQPARLMTPAARFYLDQLPQYPVIVVTHAFYKGERGEKARYVLRNYEKLARAFTVVDEQMDDVPNYDVVLWEAERVWDKIKRQRNSDQDAAYVHTLRLLKFMRAKANVPGKGLEKPSDDEEAWRLAQELQWFSSDEAKRYSKAQQDRVPEIAKVFGFARSMAQGHAFIARSYNGAKWAQFVGYEPQFTIVPGMVLLDATSDIDGVTSLCPWRAHVEVPHARYDNLSIVHVDCYTDEILADHLESDANCVRYMDWMKTVVREHMEPGQKGLVVSKKTLVDKQYLPDWPKGDKRFREQLKFTEEYGWELDKRLLSVTYWGGNGIGSNVWRDADVVFLFGEHFLPRRAYIGTAQGLLLAKATGGALASMDDQKNKSEEVDGISDGHLMRWTKQMALRGRGRRFDGQGVCGKQKLILTGDYERLLLYKDRMFPGAKLTAWRPDKDLSHYKTWRRTLLEVLSDPELANRINTKELGQRLGIKWANISGDVMGEETEQMLKALGWAYVPQRGRGGSWFEKTDQGQPAGQPAEQPGRAIAAE
jgi:hypothetical protein